LDAVKEVLDHKGLIMGRLGEEPKAGQGRELCDFERNKSMKIEEQGNKKG